MAEKKKSMEIMNCFEHLTDTELYNLGKIINISLDKGLKDWFLDNLSEYDQVRFKDTSMKPLKDRE